MSVLTTDFQPITDDSLTVVTVTTGSGSTYTVDVREGRCTCPDHKHRNATCKHLRRARVSLAHDSVDSETLARLDIDAGLGANAPGPVVTTSDGGVVGGDGAELVDDDEIAATGELMQEYDLDDMIEADVAELAEHLEDLAGF
jgi:hypothetical protein